MATHLHEFVVAGRAQVQQKPRPRAAQHNRTASPALLENDITATVTSCTRPVFARPPRRSVSCSALQPGELTAAASAAASTQQTSHESLLNNAAGSAWEFLQTVLASSDEGSPLDAVATAAKSFPTVRSSISERISVISDSFSTASNAVSDASPSGAWQLFSSVSGAASASWANLLQSLSGKEVAELLSANAGAVDFTAPSSASWGENIDLQSALSSMALFNGTFSEPEKIAIVCTTAAVISLATITAAVAERPFEATTASDAELPSEYNREAIYEYWTQQPVTMINRSLETAIRFSGFLIGRQLDKLMGKEQENELIRARMLREAVDSLGPAYIKVAQALSTRADLLSPAYYNEITLLQDQVKPFPTEEAMAILEQELGRPVNGVFSTISSKPIAAASLGQVYRATLASNGADVAVKVQRPGVLELVALDLVIGRKGIEIAGSLFPDIRAEQIIPVLDEWAYKLYREMDYRRERNVMQQFAADLSDLSGILVPESYEEATTRRVLCTQWIQGEKLSESTASDVRELCTTLLNAYLIQLLDTGLLHADPHPGNLIRTPDGKICILDYGLVTEVPPNFRVYILEYMAHLSLKDWHAVGDDFVKLQFVAPDSMHPNDIPGLMDAVGAVLEVLMLGGGAKNLENIRDKNLLDNVGIDPGEMDQAGFMDGFATVMDNLSNPDQVGGDAQSEKDRARRAKIKLLREQIKFQLPPYFVLILRAFSVIEGIALKVDPEYSIINETFPYLSRRLLTDNSAEVRRALRQVLYGDGKRMDVERFRTLFDSLGRFSTDGLTAGTPPAGLPAPPAAPQRAPLGGLSVPQPAVAGSNAMMPQPGAGLDKNTIFALQSVFNTSGNSYVQELLVEELAATLDSLSRGAAVTLLQRSLGSSISTATLSLVNSLGPLRRMLLPFPLPVEIISHFGNVVTLTKEDEVAIRNVEILWGFARPQIESQAGGQQQLQLSLLRSFATSVQELPSETRQQLVAGVGRTSQMVFEQLTQRTASRFAQDIASVRQQTGTMADILGTTSTTATPQASAATAPAKASSD